MSFETYSAYKNMVLVDTLTCTQVHVTTKQQHLTNINNIQNNNIQYLGKRKKKNHSDAGSGGRRRTIARAGSEGRRRITTTKKKNRNHEEEEPQLGRTTPRGE